MRKTLSTLLLCTAAQAATYNVKLTVNAAINISGSPYTASGTAALTGDITDTGTFGATIPTTALESATVSVPYTLTLKQGTMAGMITLPIQAILSQSSGSAPATVTSATIAYSGYTGSFTLTGSGSLNLATGSITVTFSGPGTLTSGGTPTNPPPTLTRVVDAASYTGGIAPGSIFVVNGSNLSANGGSTSYPLPTSSGGTSITFTPVAPTTGSPTQAYIIYTYLAGAVNQLAAILPSTVAVGTYNVTVTYNNSTSTAVPAQVVANKVGVLTQDATGNGLAAAQVLPLYNLNRLTTGSFHGTPFQPAHPGDSVVVYAIGMGAVTGGDTAGVPNGFNFVPGLNVQVILGGSTIAAPYAGRTPGVAGLDQINFNLPANIATGCAVPLQISVNGTVSTVTTLSIAPAGSDSCVYPGYTTSQLAALDQGGTITSGGMTLDQITSTSSSTTVKSDSVGGEFSQLTGFELSSATSQGGTSSTQTIGSCIIYQSQGGTTVVGGGVGTALDAGNVTITGPSGTSLSNTALTESGNAYELSIGTEGITIPGGLNGKILAGTYTLAGAGGKDVGPFNVSLTLGPLLAVTGGLPATVTESSGLPINWTGGNSSDTVEIIGSTSTGTGLTAVYTGFICTTTAGQGNFTVPPTVLTQLPKSANGSLGVYLLGTPVPFTPSLTAGGTVNAAFSAAILTAGSAAYQ